ncbi:MAG: Ig-like domain-containing protein [Planctomycetota bacterium]|jgi:hypothetical protein
MKNGQAIASIISTILLSLTSSLSVFGNPVNNPSMEGIFVEQGYLGYVAESWTGWFVAPPGGEPEPDFYEGTAAHAHSGSKSQGTVWSWYGPWPFLPAGVYQQVTGLQAGAGYLASCWIKFDFTGYSGPFQADGITVEIACSVGVDPNSGTDPQAVTGWGGFYHYTGAIAECRYESGWVNLYTYFAASDSNATLFVKAEGFGDAWIEDWYCEPPPCDILMADWDARAYVDDVVIEPIEVGSASTVEATSPVPANGANYSMITITVVDANGDPIDGVPPGEITVEATGTGNTIVGPMNATDAEGKTTAELTSTVAETKIITASVLGALLADGATVEFLEPYLGSVWHVDASNTGYGDGSPEQPFPTISDGILAAQNGDTVLVEPGRYYENVDFCGKATTVQSIDPNSPAIVESTIIDANDSGSVVSFKTNEGADSILTGFTVTGGNAYRGGGIYCSATSPRIERNIIINNKGTKGGGLHICHGTINNCVIANNLSSGTYSYGGGLYNCDGRITNCLIINNSVTGSNGGGLHQCDGHILNCSIANNRANFMGGGLHDCDGTIKNCIIWGNVAEHEGNQLQWSSVPTFSCVQGGSVGLGNVDTDPCFADPCNGDYHLRSAVGRWDPNSESWVSDANTSLCIDAGNPGCDPGEEPVPNGNRINMGAYGGTAEASKSPAEWALPADLTNDRKVDFNDLKTLSDFWPETGRCLPCDLNRDELVNLSDFAILARHF